MQEPLSARLTWHLLTGVLVALAPALVAAGVVQDCRAETTLYGISPEQADDYVRDCIQSRGGYPADTGQPETAGPGTDSVPVDVAGETGDSMTQGDNSGVEETTDGTQ